MADLLAKWLNEEINLSQKIIDFEKDFSSGYLLGELLYKFNQQDNFQNFSKKDNISSKVKNFEKLEPTLRNLNIKFDSILVDKIMKQERGYALRLLYQLKMVLEKVYPPTDISIVKKTGKVGDNQPALKIGPAKAAYNKMQHQFFKTRLQALNKPQKLMDMEEKQQKFIDEKIRQDDEAKRYAQAQKLEEKQQKLEARKAQINKLQRNAGFMEEWLAKGVEDWKQNMAYKKERDQSQLEFEYKFAQKFNQITIKKIEDATAEVNDGIQKFEETLMNNGINPSVTQEYAEKVLVQSLQNNGSPAKMKSQKFTQSLLQKPSMGLGGTMTKTGGITLASVGLRSKAKKPLDEKIQIERERRRMRMITDQLSLIQDIEKNRREQEVIQRMKKLAKQEEELSYESWRTFQCKGIIVENRKLREAKYDKRHELDTQNSIFKEKEMLEQMQDQMSREIQILQDRDNFMRQKDKEAKKQRQTIEARKMIDVILDISHEAYIHQQKQDSNQIDPRNWHEWEQLFIEGSKIMGENLTLQQTSDAMKNDNQDQLIQQSTQEQIQLTEVKDIDQLEFKDYLTNKGQWPQTLVSENKPNLEQILSGIPENAPVAAKGKAPVKGAPATDSVQLEEGDLVIADKADNNFFVGDAVEQIIDLNFPARGRQLRPKNPHYLNLKLCFVGYAFAGKQLQAMKLKQEYGLQSFTLNDLVEEALKYYSENPDKIQKRQFLGSIINESMNEDSKEDVQDELPQQKSNMQKTVDGGQDDVPPEDSLRNTTTKGLRRNPMFEKSKTVQGHDEEETKSEDSEFNEELNPEEDFRKCGEQINQYLYLGEEIPDQLYVDLFVAKLRLSYDYKEKEELKEKMMKEAKLELDFTRQLANLHEELRKLNDSNTQIKKKKKRNSEVVQQEIQILQQELAKIQTIENNGWILIDFPNNFSQAMLLEKALSGYIMPADLEPIQRDIEKKDAFLLVKPTPKPEPPKNLIPSGIDAVIWFDANREECLRRALGRRIDNQTSIIYHIQDNPPSIEKSPLCEIIESIDDESESMACLIDKWVAFDQQKSGLQKWLSQFGDESSQTNLIARIEASGNINSVYEQIDNILKFLVQQKSKKQQFLRSRFQSAIIEREEEEQKIEDQKKKQQQILEDKQASEEQKSVNAGGNTGRSVQQSKGSAREASNLTGQGEELVINKDNIENDFKNVLMQFWKQLSTNYKSQMIKVLRKQRIQRDNIQQFIYNIQIQFLTYLKRLDSKQQILDKFVLEFNEFSDQYPDMREDDLTKEELHQRVDILSDELWEIEEERKEQAVEERKKIMESGWVEFSLEYLTSCSQQMMQSEIDKFKGTIQLIHDYYHAIEEKIVPESPENFTVDLAKEEADLPEVEKLPEGQDQYDINVYLYPRLDDLYKRALKAQQVPDVIALAALAEANKKGAKKIDPKAAKGGTIDTDAGAGESLNMKEMREAVKLEKSILRFRLTQIRNWTLLRLKKLRELSLKVYQKLDDWINVSSKVENDAIEEVCDVIKEAIENQSKIQDELRIKFMDFFVDKTILNFIEPLPDKLDALEEVLDDRFNIPQLKSLVQELSLITDQDDMIINRKVVDLFLRKIQNSKTLNDLGGLPKKWNQFERSDFEKILNFVRTKY